MTGVRTRLLACQNGLIAVGDEISEQPGVFKEDEPFGSPTAIAYNPDGVGHGPHCADVIAEIKRSPAILKAIGC